ncbi:restriction endonuclease subunit S [Escherichia coli]|nr:restriction endonuclease subunit S [Escherichia coli]MCJ2994983.1 restriction endonuclease subunit S [Escherichia coli]MCJ3004688.1 restriction endonuclease subunit S [Escherichia coli]MCJ3065503.1 restriction endonuclease subunit S [Escherichia coli]
MGQMVNDVRGSVDGWDFKQYILGALFNRFISENFSSHMEYCRSRCCKKIQKKYFKGMKELADKKFIAETMIQNYYFINPGYMFNGHRLTYMKTYYLKDKNE